MKLISIAAILTASFIFVSLALAQIGGLPNVVSSVSNNVNLGTIYNNIINIVLGVLVVVAVVFAIASGYLYLTAAGDTAKVRKAGEMLIYAGVAIGVGLLAKGVMNIVLNVLGITGTTVQ